MNPTEQHEMLRECLSALVDGELECGEVAHACVHWRENGDARSAWHAYQLIGDVLRSDDLGADPAHESAFLDSLRKRLASEPVVLAPRPLPSVTHTARPVIAPSVAGGAGRARRSWLAPMAAAAGVMAVVGTLVFTAVPGLEPERQLADNTAQPAPMTAAVRADAASPLASTALPSDEPQTIVASGELIRDARLDRYLAAHKQFAGSSALGVPSAFLRNATVRSATAEASAR